MKVLHTLGCFFFLPLLDGSTGVVNAEFSIITGKEGGDVTHGCKFSAFGRRGIFCRDECKEKDILVETNGFGAQRGRYSIEYRRGTELSPVNVLKVGISNLTKSDSGRYICSYYRILIQGTFQEFEIRVKDASVDRSGVVLPVRLTLLVVVIVSSAAALIFRRRRASKSNEPPVEVDYVNVADDNRVSEETREDGSPLEETSAV